MAKIGARRHPLVLLLVVFAMLAAACSGNDDSGSPTREESGDGDVAPDPDDGEDEIDYDPDGTVRVAYDLVLQSIGGLRLDPIEQSTLTNDALLYLVYGRFMRPTADGGLEPDLAESANVVNDTTIEVALRDAQTFHDGSPLDAEAAKAALDRTREQGDPTGLGEDFASLESVEVIDELTLRLNIPDGTAASWYDTFIGGWQTGMAKDGPQPGQPIGAGPFSIAEFRPEESLLLERYDGYWDAESITLGGIELIHVASGQEQSAIAAVRTGQIDVTITDASQLQALGDGIESIRLPSTSQTVQMQVCKREGPLANADVRLAVNKAIDRQAIAEAIYNGTATPQSQLWPEGHRFYDEALEDTLTYDPDAARDLLADAGFAEGFEFDLYIVPALQLPEVGEVVKQQLQEIGVTVNLKVTAAYVDEFLTPDSAGAGLIPGSSEGLEKLAQFSGDQLGNACNYVDPELDELVQQMSKISQASDEAEALWSDIQEIVVGEALGVFILFRDGLVAYSSERLGDVALWPRGSVIMVDPRATTVLPNE